MPLTLLVVTRMAAGPWAEPLTAALSIVSSGLTDHQPLISTGTG